jgi:hypothetical protein
MAQTQAPEKLTGGCLCGALRYEARPDAREGYYCHCRMCQLAFGNTRAAFLNLRKDQVTWTHALRLIGLCAAWLLQYLRHALVVRVPGLRAHGLVGRQPG